MKRNTKSKSKKSKVSRLKTLILTETAEKAKTIRKFIGRQYLVASSDGFLRDLPKTQLGLDIENDFEPKYITVRGKGKLLEQLRKETLKARRIYLATDSDYEGEMIALHYCQLFGVNPVSNCRLVFNEVTKDSLKSAIKNAKSINMRAVEAYETRRAIDRLFIYELNPLLWYKIYRGISINRHQALVLKMICDQEKKLQPIIEEDDNLIDNPNSLKNILFDSAKKLKLPIGNIAIAMRQLYEGLNIENTCTGLITYNRGDEIRPSSEMRTPESVKEFLTSNQWKIYNLIWQYSTNGHLEDDTTNSSDVKMIRYNDYALMKELEAKGLSWTKTFVVAICGLLKRKYVEMTEGGYKPTKLGLNVFDVLKENFSTIISLKMAKKIETQIEGVYNGQLDKLQVINDFYKQFNAALKKAHDKIGEDIKPKEPPIVETDEICDKCGRKMLLKRSRYGLFLACSGYPECKNTKPYIEYLEEKCPKCGGRLTKRKWNKGREFYTCENFPQCDFSTWDEPQPKHCSECGAALFLHRFKDRPAMIYCSNENCPSRANHPINKIHERWKQLSESKKANKANKVKTKS